MGRTTAVDVNSQDSLQGRQVKVSIGLDDLFVFILTLGRIF